MSRRRRDRHRKDTGREQKFRDLSDVLYPTLDLHGRTEAEADRVVRRWLQDMQAAGEPVCRIITGRGLHSIGLAVLPASVAALLDELKGDIVQGYEREPGGGAYRIRLRRPSVTPMGGRTHALRGLASPELIRQAEEALAELGVEPTPTLVEAEVRRILSERRKCTG